jgi:bifunctional UDP-N-acetylglucosamine pyrophosphorylase/glucosamine-1-phosphate N-acetyltransferase
MVLAAGLGTRMRSRTPKVLHPICGRPMLAYVVDLAREATGVRPVVVISPATASARELIGPDADYALQEEPRGTGDAVRVGLEALPADVREVVVLSGDTPLFTAETVRGLAEARRHDGAVMSLATFRPDDTAGYGRIVRDDAAVRGIVETKDASEAELAIEEVNAGLYAFDGDWLRARIGDLAASTASGEIYLTELVALAAADGRLVTAYEVDDELEPIGVDDRLKLAAAEAELRWRILEAHLAAGVTMQDPTTTYVDADVELAEDVTLEPFVTLRGRTRIGRDTVIGRGSEIVDSVIGERCRIRSSVVEESEVEDDVSVGPFSHLRSGARVGTGATIGNFAEIKQSRLGPGAKQHHFSYLGDADVGRDVNIGAGTITANFDGRRKHRTVIGDRAFIGSDTILRAPVTVGEDAATGAGSVVTRDVPDGKLAVGMPARVRERRPATDDATPDADRTGDR